MGSSLLLVVCFLVAVVGAVGQRSRPAVINVGALFTYNSTIGRAAKLAIELAVADVNDDKRVLAGTKLNVIMQDTMCSGFLGIVEGINHLCLSLWGWLRSSWLTSWQENSHGFEP